jgi:transposase
MPKIKDIIQLAKDGKTVSEIALIFNKSIPTINRYIALLRKEGYIVPITQGRPRIKVD